MRFAALVLTACVALAQESLDSILAHMERGGRLERGFLDRSSRYLDQERTRIAARDFTRAFLVAGAYQRLGAAYVAQGYVPGALQNYYGAMLVLNEIASVYPQDPRLCGEMIGVAGRVRALGGTVPIWFSIPIGDSPGEGQDSAQMPVLVKEVVPDFEMPKVDWSQLSDQDRKSCNAVIEQYLQTAASAKGALTMLEDLRASMQSQGLSLRAEYLAGQSRIKLRMERARRSIEECHCNDGQESLAIVREEVRRLLRDFGQ